MSIPKLMAARYDDRNYTGTNPVEFFDDPENVGIRLNILKGGIQRIELTIRAHSENDAYNRYKNHLGQLIAVFDSYLHLCITGNVFEVVPDGRNVTYICPGPERRLEDDLYTLTRFQDITVPTDNTDVVIKDILDDAVTILSSDQSNIATTGIDIGAWMPQKSSSSISAGEAIFQLADMGKSDFSSMDFYLVDQTLNGVQIQKPLPYFKARSETAAIDWQFNREDLARDGLELARNIWNLQREIYVRYGRITGTADGGESAHLIDADGAFEERGVAMGDRVVNLATGKSGTVEAFVDAVNDDELDLTDHPLGSEWSTGDDYVIQLQNLQLTSGSSSSETDLWTVRTNYEFPYFDQTQAETYRDKLMGLFEKPVLQQAFVLSSPRIRDGNGALWPLWTPLFMPSGSAYFRANDIFPEAALFDTSDDREKAFMAVTMDYEYRDNRLRIVPSTGDSRLDVMLAQALAEDRRVSEIISAQ